MKKLLELSHIPNKGQKEFNERHLKQSEIMFSDSKKEEALKYAFVNSRVLLVYGAAGTGKTTLINMISTMMTGRRKLFLTKTHTALQNLQRRIENPGADASFVSIDSFTKRVNLPDYDIIFVDECSTIDNRVTNRFSLLYNNLKGRIIHIDKRKERIIFTVDITIPLTEKDCQNDGLEFVDTIEEGTRIRFDVLAFEEEMPEEDREKTIVPFQLAYAVSIHKAQGLEYKSVKVVIPSSNAEK